MNLRIPSLVCGHVDLGEADRIVRLLTDGKGRVDARVRGARKSRKRYAGALDPGTLLLAELRGKGELKSLGEVRILSSHLGLRSDLIKTAVAAQVLELGYGLAPEEGDDHAMFSAALHWIRTIDGAERLGPLTRVAAFLALLDAAGLAPDWDRCVRCGRGESELAEPLSGYHVADGGPLCADDRPPDAQPAPPEVLALLRAAAGGEQVCPPGAPGRAAADLVDRIVFVHLGRRLKSSAFLESLRA